MPKNCMNFQNTVIYKIVCKDITIKEVYVGNTTNFINRKYQHKKDCLGGKNYYVYQFINEHGGWENWDMIEIEKYPCNDNCEARKRERYWYEELNAILNTRLPQRTDEEKQLYNLNFMRSNKEILKEKRKIYMKNDEVRLLNNARVNEYNKKNKEQISEQRKQARLKCSKIDCGCGSSYLSYNKHHHIKTKRHLKYLETIIKF